MKIFTLLFLLGAANSVFAANENSFVDSMIDEEHVRVWNRFAEQVLALHRQQLARHRIRAEEHVGRYGGEMAKHYRYRETSYFEADTDRLLSRVRIDRDHPENVQIGEVYVYDDAGKVLRDYIFIYLPWGRGAPVSTFISLHDYPDGMHAYRQFDASGNVIYEYCDGTFEGQNVQVALQNGQDRQAGHGAELYRRCFTGVPAMAGDYLTPH